MWVWWLLKLARRSFGRAREGEQVCGVVGADEVGDGGAERGAFGRGGGAKFGLFLPESNLLVVEDVCETAAETVECAL